MIARLKDFASRKAYHLMRKKGVFCPDCGQSLLLPPIMPEGGLKAQMACGRCDWRGSLVDVIKSGGQLTSPLETKPEGSRIRSTNFRWVIPGTGKMNSELVIGLVWFLFCLAFVGIVLCVGKGTSLKGGLIFASFMLPFSSVGLWLFYVGAWKCWGEVSVRINRDDFKVIRRLFGRIKEKRVPSRQLEGIRLDLDSESESGTTMDLVIARKKGKDLKVDLEVSRDEKRWLLGQWQQAMGVAPKVDESELQGGEFAGSAIDDGVVELEPGQGGSFRLTVRGRAGLWMFFAGAFHVTVGLVLCLGPEILDDGDGKSGILRVIDLVFNGLGMVVGLVATLGGLVLLVGGYLKLGEVKKYSFETDRVDFATVKRGGRISKKDSWSCAEIREVMKIRIGHSNGDSRFQVQLRGPENMNLVSFSSEEVADELVGWVRNWIKRGESS